MVNNLVKIGDIFNIEKGNVQSSKNIAGNFTFITAGAEWKTHNEYSHDCEALIFAMGAAGSLGRTHYFNGKFIASDLCFILTPKNEIYDEIDLKFYFHYFNLIREDIVKNTSTGTSKLAINMRNFSSYEVVKPVIGKQIITKELIENTQPKSHALMNILTENLDHIRKLRKSILLEAIQGKLVPQDPNDESVGMFIEKIKDERLKLTHSEKEQIELEKKFLEIKLHSEIKGWLQINTELICDNITKGTTPQANDLLESGDVPYLKVYNIVDNKIDFNYKPQFVSSEVSKTLLKRSRVFPNDVLMNIVGPPLGKIAIVNGQYSEWNINQALAIFRTIKYVLPEYLYLVLVEGKPIRDIQTVGTAGQDNISLTQCRNFNIPLPPLKEQERIIQKVDQLMSLCDELEYTVEQSKQESEMLMQSILKEAFRTSEKVNNVLEFSISNSDDVEEEWDMVARAEGVSPETQAEIADTLKEIKRERR